MSELNERVKKIVDCVEEINQAMKLQVKGDWNKLLWEMDARRELHRLIFEYGSGVQLDLGMVL